MLRERRQAAIDAKDIELYLDLTWEMAPYDDAISDARRQVLLCQAKKMILEQTPQVFDVKTFAITVCPESCETHFILNDIAKLINSAGCVLSNKYVYEQRSKIGEPEKGWHIHCYVQTTYRQSKLKQFIQQKLKKISHILDVRPADTRYLTHYMAGDKGTVDKTDKVARDRELRKTHGIQELYEYVK